MSPYAVLVVAKAPVAGQAKTRLGAVVGHQAAADVAAAALLDTLDAARAAVGAERCVLALTGDLVAAERCEEIAASLDGWSVVPQQGDGFDERLAAAHADAGRLSGGAVVQIGMDTPQVTSALLEQVATALHDHDAVLGPADDGGWWVLALRDPADAAALRGVAMSATTTYDHTLTALLGRGLRVAVAPTLCDVDTVTDADVVASDAPTTRFAASWAALTLGATR